MDSIIKKLQAETLKSEIPVSDLLRKAKVVAVKLDLKDFLRWIENELNGYKTKVQEELPSYRIIRGETKGWNPYRGWIPILFSDPGSQELLSSRGISQPIGELDDIFKSKDSGSLFVDFNPEARNAIAKAIGEETDIKFLVAKNSVAGILDAVRNVILDWSLKLEKEGILGEGLSFSDDEAKRAKEVGAVYNIDRIENFAGVMGNMSENSKANVKQINASKEELKSLVNQIRKYASQIELAQDKYELLDKNLSNLESEVQTENPIPARIKNLLSSIKNILEGATGNVVAQGIIFGIQKLIG